MLTVNTERKGLMTNPIRNINQKSSSHISLKNSLVHPKIVKYKLKMDSRKERERLGERTLLPPTMRLGIRVTEMATRKWPLLALAMGRGEASLPTTVAIMLNPKLVEIGNMNTLYPLLLFNSLHHINDQELSKPKELFGMKYKIK